MRIKLFILGNYKCILYVFGDFVYRHIIRVLVTLKDRKLFSLVIIGYGGFARAEGLRSRRVYQHLRLILHRKDHIAVFKVQKQSHSEYRKKDYKNEDFYNKPELAMLFDLFRLSFTSLLRRRRPFDRSILQRKLCCLCRGELFISSPLVYCCHVTTSSKTPVV